MCTETIIAITSGSSSQLVCPPIQQTIRCSPGNQIVIDYVLYGRTNQNICNPSHAAITNLNCVSTQTSTRTVEAYCNSQSACILKADSQWLGEDPCPGTPKYLQVRTSESHQNHITLNFFHVFVTGHCATRTGLVGSFFH